MNPKRSRIVEKAFNSLDRNLSGQITVQDIVNLFDVSHNPAFIERRKTKEQILNEFLNNFEGSKRGLDGIITREHFFEYYRDISMNFPADEYFIKMMETTW